MHYLEKYWFSYLYFVESSNCSSITNHLDPVDLIYLCSENLWNNLQWNISITHLKIKPGMSWNVSRRIMFVNLDLTQKRIRVETSLPVAFTHFMTNSQISDPVVWIPCWGRVAFSSIVPLQAIIQQYILWNKSPHGKQIIQHDRAIIKF